MARLTIEDKWWSDPRRVKLAELVGSMLLADAWAVRLWRLAQEHYGRGRKPIPKGIFDALEAAPKLIEAGLAFVEAEAVHVRGSGDFLDWLNAKRAAAKAGGKKSVTTRKKKYGTAQPDPEALPKHSRSTPEANSNCLEPSGSGSVSGSVIPFPSETGAAAAPPAVIDPGKPPVKAGKNGVALWLEAYHRKYGVRYELTKQDTKMLSDFRSQRTEEHTATLFAAYCAMDGPKKLYAQAKHALSLFFRDIASISVAAQTGIDPAQEEIPDWEKKARAEEAERKKQNGPG